MFYFLVLIGLIAIAVGIALVGFSLPISESPLGAALLVAASVAMTGGIVLIGLAAALRELRGVAQVLRALKVRTPSASRPRPKATAPELRPAPPAAPPEVLQSSPNLLEAQTKTFETMWPASRGRHDGGQDEPDRQHGVTAEPPARTAPVVPADVPEPELHTILKTGVIEDMAYTLYSDGTITAKMSDSTMRFGSIDELRQYLNRRNPTRAGLSGTPQ
jgi:hypothetical protein